MRPSTRWATASLVLLALLLIGCGGALPHIPITITIPPPSEPQPAPEPPATNPVDYDCYMASRGTSDPAKRYDECMAAKVPAIPPPAVEPAPAPERPLQNLNIVVHDARGDGIATAACSVNGDGRKADGSGFINFAVRDSVIVACSAPGFQTRSADLPPGDHRFPLASIASPPPGPTPTPTPAAAPCVGGGDALACVRSIATAHAQLLTTNTFESCAEFLGHLLAALGPDFGYVGKVAGNIQHVPKGFIQGERVGDDGKRYFVTGVSHDAIKRRDGQVFDVVVNAAANEPCHLADRSKCWTPGPASVEWNVVPPQDWRKDNPFVPASAVPR